MAGSVTTRIDADLFDLARATGAAAQRSAAQQLAYWVRLGREIEAATAVSARDLRRLGSTTYDEMGPAQQAEARAQMREDISRTVAGGNKRERLAERTRVSADSDGVVTVEDREQRGSGASS